MPYIDGFCPLEELLARIGGKWKVIILWKVVQGPKRFGVLKREMPGVTQKMLTAQLRELERDGMLHRHVFAEVPPRVEYSATPLAQTLQPVLRIMHDWSVKFLLPSSAKTRRTPVRKARSASMVSSR